jgi:hypothetical protein
LRNNFRFRQRFCNQHDFWTLLDCQLAVRHNLRGAIQSHSDSSTVVSYRAIAFRTSLRWRSRRGFKTALEVFVEV